MNEKIINLLNGDSKKLVFKLEKALERNDLGTYRNLLKAIYEVEELLSKYDVDNWKRTHLIDVNELFDSYIKRSSYDGICIINTNDYYQVKKHLKRKQ